MSHFLGPVDRIIAHAANRKSGAKLLTELSEKASADVSKREKTISKSSLTGVLGDRKEAVLDSEGFYVVLEKITKHDTERLSRTQA